MATSEIRNGKFLNGTQAPSALYECASSLLSCPAGLSAVQLSSARAYMFTDIVRVNDTIVSSYTCIQAVDFTCNSYKRGCNCPNLQPDADIAGTGVVLSFIVVAILSFIIYIICMFLAMINTTSMNPKDKWLRERVTKLMNHRISDERKEIWLKSLTKVLLGLSDQQLVTCLAVLIVAVVKLADGSLTVYHFTICADLASCSNAVHTMTLDVLASYFRRRVKFPTRADTLRRVASKSENGKVKWRRMPLMTTLRMALMTICAALLIFCFVLGNYWPWYDVFACPANCAREDLEGNYDYMLGSTRIILLLISQPIAVMALTNTGINFSRAIQSKHMEKPDARPSVLYHSLSARAIARLTKHAAAFRCYYSSDMVRALLSLINVVLGVYLIMGDRAVGHAIMTRQDVPNDELEWGFGQLVPLIFCVLPFIAAGESYWDEYLATRDEGENSQDAIELEEEVEMNSISGVPQSQPAASNSSDAPVPPEASESSALPLGSTSAIGESDDLTDEGRSRVLRRSTFPIDRA
ncbi:hypothetical protein LTR10_010158 [Elasticomyces elasticus]|nr:hypothetical protein LTR10_010158 [Elasticomyces elasticus]KAK4972063.1 hypothetical protein LTR42_006568 [Elasticomyces elasticus]